MINIRIALSIILIAFMLSSCGSREEQRELRLYIKQMKDQANTTEKKPLMVEYQLPKPVKYIGLVSQSSGTNAGSGEVSKPLQSYPLKDLQFVGTIVQDNETWAYILTPDNMIYGAKEGDIIGNSYGKISKITTDHIEVRQQSTEVRKTCQSNGDNAVKGIS